MENQPYSSANPGSGPVLMSQSDERMWAMLTHLSALLGSFVAGFGAVIAPVIIWQIYKERSAFVDFHGKEAVNFQITMLLAFVVAGILVFVLIGIFLLWILGAIWLVLVIIAAIKANNGEHYRYPFSIRFIK